MNKCKNKWWKRKKFNKTHTKKYEEKNSTKKYDIDKVMHNTNLTLTQKSMINQGRKSSNTKFN